MKTVLIVDDVEMNRELLAEMLEEEYQVLTAADGDEALTVLDDNPDGISVLLLDLVMPKKNGLEVLDYLNETGRTDRLPVLIITGEQGPETEEACLSRGAADFIKKPFDNTLVHHRIRNAEALFSYKNSLEEKVAEQTEDLRKKNLLLKQRNDDLIELLSNVVEARSLESGSHVRRVKKYTGILAAAVCGQYPEYGLDEHKIEIMTTAAAMHDIGKISVPDAILLKPGRLTDEEFDEMKKHTLYGVKILEDAKDFWDEDYYTMCVEICRSHHERWNGRGYPDALAGDEIPLSAQIVAFADCYDALTTDRVYKKAIPPDTAFEMILNGECGAFNPKLVESFKLCRGSFAETAAIR